MCPTTSIKEHVSELCPKPPSWSPVEPPADAQDDLSVLRRIAHKVICLPACLSGPLKVEGDEPIGGIEEILIKLNCSENPAGSQRAWDGGGGFWKCLWGH